jgi:ABC-type branched-subunit amino acid transport system substrate-binding protein
MRTSRPSILGGLGLALALVGAACGSSSGGSSSATTAAAAPATTAAAAPATTAAAAPATTAAAPATTAAAPATTAAPAAAGPPPNAPGFDGTTIKLGMIAALSGPVAAPIGIPLANGNRVFWEAVNAKGGIGGKYKVQLVEGDGKYDVAETVKQYGAIKDKVVSFEQVIGTPMVQALLQSLNEDHILVQPATLDSIWQNEKYLLPIGAPYQIQAANGLSYYVQQNGKDKVICSMVIDSAYGQAGEQGLEYAAQQLGVKIAVKQTHKQGDTDFTAQINAFKNGKCDAVWITALPVETSGIMGRAAQVGFNPQWIAQSPTFLSLFLGTPLGPYMKAHEWLISEGPQWGDTSKPGMVQMLNDIKASKIDPNQKPDGYFAFGYVEAWAVDQVLEQAVKNGDLSRDGVIKAVNDLGELKFQGLFDDEKIGDPGVRQAPRANTVFGLDPATVATNGGTKPIIENYESDAAKSFNFAG